MNNAQVLFPNIYKPKGQINGNLQEGCRDEPIEIYTHPNGKIFHGDSIKWLNQLESESVDLIFADPPYNIKKADWDSWETMEMYINWSLEWIEAAHRVLKKDGTLYVCGFSEILADIKHPAMKFFKKCRWIVWHYKNKANLSNDWGRSHESILHFRKNKKTRLNVDDIRIPYSEHTLKYPTHPQAKSSQYGTEENSGKNGYIWTPHPNGAKPKDVIEIPTTCNGMNEKTPHPTQKPEELLRKIVLASSQPGDIILDPFLGSGTTAVVSEQLGRKWLGCDQSDEYIRYAIERIEKIPPKTVQEWIAEDHKNMKRRKSIR